MESLFLSNQYLKNLDLVEVEIKSNSKSVIYFDLSNNYLQ